MKTIYHKLNILFLGALLALMTASCSEDNTSDLRLEGDTWLTSIVFDGQFEGTIDRSTLSVTVAIPQDYATDKMEVTAIEVAEGAEATLKVGDLLDMSVPQVVRVTNGDVFLDFTINVKHDTAQLLSFKLNDTYVGIIDQNTGNVQVNVPAGTDVTSLVPSATLSEGAVIAPSLGKAIDFTHPVDFVVSFNTASTVYTVTVVATDAPDAVYVGLAASIDQLNAEEKEAASWMMTHVANAQYVSFADIKAGRTDLSKCKLMWWHLHIDGGIDSMDKFDKAAPAAVEAVETMKELYNNGMNFLLTRYATYYATKLGATKDGNYPNNCWGQSEESGEITGGAWNFFIQGHETHPLYQNLILNGSETDKVYTCDAGYRITNSTAQWHIGTDWGGYADNGAWRTATGGTDLGYGGDGAIVVWEYQPEGSKGGIVCIGSGCYDWYAYGIDASGDRYHANVAKMTENAMNYLTDK